MAKIRLSGGFTILPEGEHVLQIISATYDEAFGKLVITMENINHIRHIERFNLLNGKEPNEAAINAFSALARAATGNAGADEIDPEDLVGCFVKGTISHRQYTANNGEIRTSSQKEPGTWWVQVSPEEAAAFSSSDETPAPTAKPSVNDLLNLLK